MDSRDMGELGYFRHVEKACIEFSIAAFSVYGELKVMSKREPECRSAAKVLAVGCINLQVRSIAGLPPRCGPLNKTIKAFLNRHVCR